MGLTKKQWITLCVIVFGTFITILNQTLVTPALPSIMTEMGIDASAGQWLTTGFTLVNAIMIPITAYLQDRFSIKALFLFSMIVFCLGTLACAWGPLFAILLLGRLIQAVGAGILMPMSMTVLLTMFPIEKRGSAMGIFGLVIAFAPAIGPTLSGIMVDLSGWHTMFYVVAALILAVILLALVLMKKPEHKRSHTAKLDKLSVVLSSVGFGGLLYGFSVLGSSGIDLISGSMIAIGSASVVWFFIRQTHLERPMLRVKILLNRYFLIATIIGMLVQAALLAAPVLMPIYVQNLMGYSATISGLVIMPGAILMGIMNPIAGKIFDRYGPRVMGIGGMFILFASTLCFGFVTTETSIVAISIIFAVRMFAMSLVNMPITTWGMNTLDTKLMNHGTSINNTLRQVAGSLGTALVISIYTALGSALTPSMGSVEAQMLGFNVAFIVCAILAFIGFVLTIIFVKGKPGTMEATGQAGSSRASKKAEKRSSNMKRIDEVSAEDESGNSRILLSSIMKKDVYVLRTDNTIHDAMQLFIDEGISGCPIIDDTGAPAGFISDGDILKTLSRRSESYTDPVALIVASAEDKRGYNDKLDQIMELPVTAIGHTNLISVNIHTDIEEVCRVLAKYHLKKVPIMENGKICGIINRSDITRYSMEAYLEGKPQEAVYCEEGSNGSKDTCG